MSIDTSSSWLLRLFKSDFFDARLCLFYLQKYPDSVGIQDFICSKLTEFNDADIQTILPQLWSELAYSQSHGST